MSTIEEDLESTLQTNNSRSRHITMAGDSGLPETYHLEGGSNYGVWAYRMKNHLQKDGRYHYCLTPPSKIMGEEEKAARQQVMSIINSNAKNNALKLLRRYDDPYECWTGLKARYESDSGPRRVMLIEKFFALRKTESVSMDAHLTEVKEIANLLEEVEVTIPEDIIVYYTLKHLPKEYEIFKRMQIAAQTLPTYDQLEAKLISEETAIKLEEQQKDDGEALFLHQNRRPQPNQRFNHFRPPQNVRHTHTHRRYTDSGGPSNLRSPSFTDSGGHHATRYASQHSHHQVHPTGQGRSQQTTYQPRFKPRGPDKPRNDRCNFCGLDGHFERECDLRSILDRMKDYEHKLLERRNRTLSGQVHHLEEPDLFKQEQDPDSFETADQVI
jgi:hypothetical protein